MMHHDRTVDMGILIEPILSSLAEGTEVILSGRGTSMEPFLTEGRDRIVLSPPHGGRPHVGEIYLYRRLNGGYSIHRVYAVKNGCVTMLGDAQLFLERGIPIDNLLGRAVRVIRENETVDCTDPKLLFGAAVRMRCRIAVWRMRVRYRSVRRMLCSILGKRAPGDGENVRK